MLEAIKLSKSYKGKVVVDQVSLESHSGEVVGLLGANGAGKTTTFHMIVGLIRPDKGELMLNGEDIEDQPMYRRARKGITYLSQEPGIFRKLTVEENILAILQTLDLSKKERKRRLESLLNQFSIAHLARNRSSSLSGGERRKVEIARALVSSPQYILLDEPFAGIDPIAIRDIQDVVYRLKAEGKGVIITDHNVRETLQVCDRVYILNEGKILEQGRPEEILGSEKVRQFFLGCNFRWKKPEDSGLKENSEQS